mgnify:FL=1
MARKIRKEKHISQRVLPNGKISLLIQIKRGGETYRKSINVGDYPTPAMAMDVACEIRDDLLRNIRNNITIEKFPTIEKLYKRMHELFPCSFKTKTKYNHYYTSAISKYADIPINKITAADIQESINNYLTTHSQEDTNRCLSVWKKIYTTAQIEEIPIIDKTLKVSVAKSKIVVEPRDVKTTLENFNHFLDALLNYHAYDNKGRYRSMSIWYMLNIMYYTGMRNAEVFALRRENIDLTNNVIKVRAMVGSDKKELGVIVPVKTVRSIRDIPICAELKEILLHLMAWHQFDYLICDYNGKLYKTDFVSNYITNVAKKNKIKFNAYMLRHLFSSDLIKSNTNLRTIQELMGHSSSSMTLAYARVTDEDKNAAIASRK